ncbi:hypothetical protein [Marinimicrococcus flavescens]|uniref:Uncharacterized protein n=1 Tax=Marinimicrococcus flavescens TaxID=3031815 RepID=A0AAP3XSW4_9PROT|nr:hypothetical protein [Marinimicrococcus flavescens]
MLDHHPEIFPLDQVEPGLGRAVAVCRELPLQLGASRTGALDNLFITETGGLVLIETKLWRNPEARRTVVAQAMDYAAAVFRLDYAGLEAAVRRARRDQQQPDRTLYEVVSSAAPVEADEAAFVDTVTRNLRRGRAVVAVVGDGIREDAAALADLLKSHAGHRFVFSLVELGIFTAPENNGHVVVPSVLARTVLIERGVVTIDENTGHIIVKASPTPSSHGSSLSEDAFYEIIERKQPGSSAHLRGFIDRAMLLNFYPDVQGSLNLKHDAPTGAPFNLASIRKDLTVNTGPSSWFGRTEIALEYNRTLAQAIGGRIAYEKGATENSIRTAEGRMPKISDLLPRHADTWLAAIERYVRALTEATTDAATSAIPETSSALASPADVEGSAELRHQVQPPLP